MNEQHCLRRSLYLFFSKIFTSFVFGKLINKCLTDNQFHRTEFKIDNVFWIFFLNSLRHNYSLVSQWLSVLIDKCLSDNQFHWTEFKIDNVFWIFFLNSLRHKYSSVSQWLSGLIDKCLYDNQLEKYFSIFLLVILLFGNILKYIRTFEYLSTL